MTASVETFQAVMDGYRDRDFSKWDILGMPEDGMFCIGLGDDLAVIFDDSEADPFILEIRGLPFHVNSIDWRWFLTIELDGWSVVVGSTGT